MTGVSDAPPVVNGWRLYAHTVFLDQIEALVGDAERARRRDPEHYVRSNSAKRLAAITKLAFDVIPQDPTRAAYRQGDTLGGEYMHSFRDVFFQRRRLFFRYGKRRQDQHLRVGHRRAQSARLRFEDRCVQGVPAHARGGQPTGHVGRLAESDP